MKLVLDTSALIYIVERRVDVGQLLEHEVYIPTAVREELALLAARNRKARAALELLPLLRPKIVERGGPADRAVLDAAKELGAVLVTGDRALAERARGEGVPVAKFHKGQLAVV
ncbi:PIN domain-containing protein [Pyrobaculum neutrophilum]|uniref:PilT protein domain protein n=1 Tax=Pyrobaculum neutrophilum (strain DSM 2338 / JCM 9278 / NBRC 100436 / V24Sta) TaxID=444157 RepID=B1YDH0_PYRNV|nr:PIN domain-containing protein [Pyrobaculum neutrophilum]ACB39833.1 PilT protein domain protein [Pyrobaculum neutrophilum V24Sta]